MVAPVEDWQQGKDAEECTEWLEQAWNKIKRGKKGSNLDQLLSSQGNYWRNELEKTTRVFKENRSEPEDDVAVRRAALERAVRVLLRIAELYGR